MRIRGRALPGGDVVDLFADGDRWTDDPVRGAGLTAEGWLLPGLVDAHTHPGAHNLASHSMRPSFVMTCARTWRRE